MNQQGVSNNRRLCRYLFTAIGGLCVAYLYNIVDGIMIGQGTGYIGLGAVDIAVPYITTMVAIAAMFPMGGATVIAIRKGRGDMKGANDAFMSSLVLTFILAAILTIIGMAFAKPIVILCGASETLAEPAATYLFYYSAFSIFMLMSTALSIFARNDDAPTLSFVGMCAGAVANIFLDWLFIFPFQWGIVGAAVASGLGQILSFAILMSHFILKRGKMRLTKFPVSKALCWNVMKCGIPEAISQMNTPVTALCYNLVLARLLGDIAVSTFSVLSFIYSLANAILAGVAQGLQPLWGESYGRKDMDEVKSLFRKGMGINAVLSALVVSALTIFRSQAVLVFCTDTELVASASASLPIFALSFIPMGFNLIYTAYFFSTLRNLQANAVAFSRGIAIKALCIFFVPVILGTDAVWLAALAAEVITLIIAFMLSKTGQQFEKAPHVLYPGYKAEGDN